MKKETMLLSELIEELEASLAKLPRVPNYEKIKETLLPGCRASLQEFGDIQIPLDKLLILLNPKN